MRKFWKYKSLPSRNLNGGLAFLLAWFTMQLLSYLLGVKSFDAFDFSSGWKPYTGWLIIYFAFFWSYTCVIGLFYKPSPSFKRQSDNYMLSVAEMEAERQSKQNKDA